MDYATDHTKDLDDIFYATKESQGYVNAIGAIKYVLFNDDTIFKGRTPDSNKYIYISKDKNARKKAMLLQDYDLAQILIKYCLQSFGLRGQNFTITDEDFLIDRKRASRINISAHEMIERVAFAAIGDTYVAYDFLYANQKQLIKVVDAFIEERYLNNKAEELDNFDGIIIDKDMYKETKFLYYKTYIHIDETFAEIKRNNVDYVK